jgi:hypothetical protein
MWVEKPLPHTPPRTAVMQQVEHAVLHDAITDRQAHCRLYFIYADDVSHALPIEHRELVAVRGVRALVYRTLSTPSR